MTAILCSRPENVPRVPRLLVQALKASLSFSTHMHEWLVSSIESVQDFLIKLYMKPCMYLVKISIFFTKSCHRQTYQSYEQPSQTSQNLYFLSFFCAKNWPNLSKKNSMKNIRLGDQLLLKNVFENFDF